MKPDIAMEQAFYLIRLGADIPLNAVEIALKRINRKVIEDDISGAAQGIRYLNIKLGQLAMTGQWIKDQAKAAHKQVRKLGKIVDKARTIKKRGPS